MSFEDATLSLDQTVVGASQAGIDVVETADRDSQLTLQGLLALIERRKQEATQTVAALSESPKVIGIRLQCIPQIAVELQDQARNLFSGGEPGWKDVQRLQKDAGKIEHTAKVRAQESNDKTSSWSVGTLQQKRGKSPH